MKLVVIPPCPFGNTQTHVHTIDLIFLLAQVFNLIFDPSQMSLLVESLRQWSELADLL